MALVVLQVNTERLHNKYYRDTINLVLNELAERTDLSADTTIEFPQIRVIGDDSNSRNESHQNEEIQQGCSVAPLTGQHNLTIIDPDTWRQAQGLIATATGKILDPLDKRQYIAKRKHHVPPKKLTMDQRLASETHTKDKPMQKKNIGDTLATLQEIVKVAVTSDNFTSVVDEARTRKIDGKGLAGIGAGTSQQDLGRLIPDFFNTHSRFPSVGELVALCRDDQSGNLNVPKANESSIRRLIVRGDGDLFYTPDSFCSYVPKTIEILIHSNVESDIAKISNSSTYYERTRLVLAIKYLVYREILDQCGAYPTQSVVNRISHRVINTLSTTDGHLRDLAMSVLDENGSVRLTGPRSAMYYRMSELVKLGIMKCAEIDSHTTRPGGGRGLIIFPDSIIVAE